MEWSRNIANGIAYYDNDNTHDDAVPVVFIHGVGLRAESWLAQLPAFADGYHCYALDMPGHGDSALLPTDTVTLTDFATAIHGFIQTVIGKPVILVGHSLGAMTALQLAISYPSAVRGVAALNAIYDRPDAAAKDVQRRAQSLLDDLDQDVSERPIARWFAGNPQYQTEADLCRLWLEQGNRLGYARAYQMFAKLRGISATDLQTITVPALMLTGELDANSSPEMSRRMAELLPNARAVIVPDARHMTQMTHASAVNAALATFFTQCDSPANTHA